MWAKNKQHGFTIVELLIVIVVIGILAAITIVAYNGIQSRANVAKRDSDLATYHKAINIARLNTGNTLRSITGSSWSIGNCAPSSGNSGNIEPKNLPQSHVCWTSYYANLANIGAASGINLDKLRPGDSNGNPYGLDENEGEYCADDWMYYFSGSGASYVLARTITKSNPC